MKTMLEDYLSEHEWAMLFIIFILLILNWHAFDTGTNPTRTWHYDQDTFNELVSDGYVEKEIYFFSFYYKNELTKVKILAYLFPVNEGLQKLRKPLGCIVGWMTSIK